MKLRLLAGGAALLAISSTSVRYGVAVRAEMVADKMHDNMANLGALLGALSSLVILSLLTVCVFFAVAKLFGLWRGRDDARATSTP